MLDCSAFAAWKLDAAVSALYFLSMNDGSRSRLVGWIALALASDLADICWYLHSGHRLPRVFVLLRALMLIPFAVSNRGPLRRFILALIAFLFGSWLQRTIEQHWIWYQHAPISRQMYADALLAIIPSMLIALTLIRSGLSRGDIYLTRGRLTARVKGLLVLLPLAGGQRGANSVSPGRLARHVTTLLNQGIA